MRFLRKRSRAVGFTPSAYRAVRNSTPLCGRGVSHEYLRMKRFGKVDIPSEAFTVMLKRD
jgi:hypothetical protein